MSLKSRTSANRTIRFLAGLSLGSIAIYMASHWWEHEFATLEWSEISPDGCVRLDTYKPFWLLPSRFHRIPHVDPEFRNPLGMRWNLPIFERAYEVSTGVLLGESITYDGASSQNFMAWNHSKVAGRRIIISGGFVVADTDRCADAATLAKLEAFDNQEAEKERARRKALEADLLEVKEGASGPQAPRPDTAEGPDASP